MASDGSSIHQKVKALWYWLTRGDMPAPLNYLDFVELDDDPEYRSGRMFLRDGMNIMSQFGDVNFQIPRETTIDVVNKSGGTILNGTPVALTTGGGAQRFAVTTYPNTDIRSLFTFGIATHDIEDDRNGVVTWFGLVRGLNTSAYSVNDPLYLGETGGTFRVGPPSGTSCRVFLGFVLVAHPTQGVIGCSVVNHRPIAYAFDADPFKASNRPATPVLGETGFDSDLGKQIVYNGAAWTNVDGTAL